MHRASADVELHSDEESEAPEGSAAMTSAAEQQSAGLQIERSSVSEAEMSASSGGSKFLKSTPSACFPERLQHHVA